MPLRHKRASTTNDNLGTCGVADGFVSANQDKLEEWKAQSTKNVVSPTMKRGKSKALTMEPKNQATGLRRVVESTYFSIFVGILIVLNGFLVGVETDLDFESLGDEWSTRKAAIDMFFTAAFTCELILKLWVHRWKFFTCEDRVWNLADALLVSMSFIEAFILSWASNDAASMREFSVLRLFRLLKVVRLLKLLSMFKQLWFLVVGLANAIPVTAWGLFLTFFVIYMAAIYITRQLSKVVKEDIAMFEYWGSIGHSMFTLFQVATGDSWASGVVRPVLKHDPNLVFFFIGFVCVTQFAVLNVVVAVIVDNVLKEALKTDEEIVKQVEAEMQNVMYELFDIFKHMDLDSSGEITRDEFQTGLSSTKVQASLERLGISFVDAEDIFDILDHDSSGTIKLEEFIEGCMKSRGPAQARDLLEVNCNVYECVRILNIIAEGLLDLQILKVPVDKVNASGETMRETSLTVTTNDGEATGMLMRKHRSAQMFWHKLEVEAHQPFVNAVGSLRQDVEQHFAKVQTSMESLACFEHRPGEAAETLLQVDSHLTKIEACLASFSTSGSVSGSDSMLNLSASSDEPHSMTPVPMVMDGSQTVIAFLPPRIPEGEPKKFQIPHLSV